MSNRCSFSSDSYVKLADDDELWTQAIDDVCVFRKTRKSVIKLLKIQSHCVLSEFAGYRTTWVKIKYAILGTMHHFQEFQWNFLFSIPDNPLYGRNISKYDSYGSREDS